MAELPFDIRHGQFLDVIGPPVRKNDVSLVPARVKLNGTSLSPAFAFIDWCKSGGHDIPAIVHGDENAPWVLGRLMVLFNAENTPMEGRGEKSCVNASFLAIFQDNENVAIPFDCVDYYGRTSLFFSSEDPPPHGLQSRIAEAYYQLLLESPDELVDYENRMYHAMAGAWVAFGVCHGEPYMDFEE
jgi:hypothetical protein